MCVIDDLPLVRGGLFIAALACALAACNRDHPEPPDRPLIVGDLEVCAQPFLDHFDPDVLQAPGADAELVVPQRVPIGNAAIAALVAGVGGAFADMTAAMIEWGYQVCHAPEVEAVVFSPPPGQGLPVLGWRPGPARPFIIEVPHPFNELRTRHQGLDAFLELRARAVIVNGAHRCAGAALPGCSGRSSACEGGYRDSDPAHNPHTVFHAMHVGLAELYHRHYAISLHGVVWDHLIVSDGTELGAPDGTPVAAAAQALDALLVERVAVRSCNGVRGLEPIDERCGTTNVQGRHLNGAIDTCQEEADRTSHRFLHLEQPRLIRDDPALRVAVLGAIFDALAPVGRE